MSPEIGRTYSRREISGMLGGDVRSYLPTKDGYVVCGCFKPRLNPAAPRRVTFGTGEKVKRAAELAAKQRQPIPVFLFVRDGAWEYVGAYRCTGLRTDSASLRAASGHPELGEYQGVLRFVAVGASSQSGPTTR
jgi:hypothetical protein